MNRSSVIRIFQQILSFALPALLALAPLATPLHAEGESYVSLHNSLVEAINERVDRLNQDVPLEQFSPNGTPDNPDVEIWEYNRRVAAANDAKYSAITKKYRKMPGASVTHGEIDALLKFISGHFMGATDVDKIPVEGLELDLFWQDTLSLRRIVQESSEEDELVASHDASYDEYGNLISETSYTRPPKPTSAFGR
jgi:hypothetical protein